MNPEEKMVALVRSLQVGEWVTPSLEGFVLHRRRDTRKIERRISYADFFRSKVNVGELYLEELRRFLP